MRQGFRLAAGGRHTKETSRRKDDGAVLAPTGARGEPASQITMGWPPAVGTFLSVALSKYPTQSPSGEKKGLRGLVPSSPSHVASSSSRDRT